MLLCELNYKFTSLMRIDQRKPFCFLHYSLYLLNIYRGGSKFKGLFRRRDMIEKKQQSSLNALKSCLLALSLRSGTTECLFSSLPFINMPVSKQIP